MTSKITFNQFKKLLTESNENSIYDQYEDLLCDVFDVDDISEITEKKYKLVIYSYRKHKLHDYLNTALEDAEELVINEAIKNGYNLVAHHGTTVKFSEFKRGDIGFHVGTLYQAREAAYRHFSDNLIMLNVAVSLHNPLFINEDFEDWNPNEILGDAIHYSLIDYKKEIEYKFKRNYPEITSKEILKAQEFFDRVEEMLKKEKGYKWGEGDKWFSELWFLYNECKFSIKEIFELYFLKNNNKQRIAIVNRLKSLGYDGIKYLNQYESPENAKGEDKYSYIIFDANQIKNCEVMSFKNGKVVPLEERFNSSTNNLFETTEEL